MSLWKDLTTTEKEARIQEVCAAYRQGKFTSIRKAAQYHSASESTVKHRLVGRTSEFNPIQKQPNL